MAEAKWVGVVEYQRISMRMGPHARDDTSDKINICRMDCRASWMEEDFLWRTVEMSLMGSDQKSQLTMRSVTLFASCLVGTSNGFNIGTFATVDLLKEQTAGIALDRWRQSNVPLHHDDTTTTSWDDTTALATHGPWQAYYDDEEYHMVYYFNAATQESQWDRPLGFPSVYEDEDEEMNDVAENYAGIGLSPLKNIDTGRIGRVTLDLLAQILQQVHETTVTSFACAPAWWMSFVQAIQQQMEAIHDELHQLRVTVLDVRQPQQKKQLIEREERLRRKLQADHEARQANLRRYYTQVREIRHPTVSLKSIAGESPKRSQRAFFLP